MYNSMEVKFMSFELTIHEWKLNYQRIILSIPNQFGIVC